MNTQEFIRLEMDSVRRIGREHPGDVGDVYADSCLLNCARLAMLEKLEMARDNGRGGWWDNTRCDIEQLRELARENLEKGDMVDVMNLAAMIYARECADK